MKKSFVLAAAALFLASAAFAQKPAQSKAGKAAVKKANAAVAADRKAMSTTGIQTTTTDVYDVTTTDKEGTLNYGVVESRTSGPRGNANSGGVVYSSFTPSKAALTNEKNSEVSFAAGGVYSFNKDDRSDRYAKPGFSTGASVLFGKTPHFALGADYMFLNPDGRSHNGDGERRSYHRVRAHNIALAGKYTLNVWDDVRFYIPMGAGLMNARMKTDAADASTSKDKWGASLYAGLGMQYDLTTDLFVGLEYRYVYAFVSDKHLSDFGRDKNLQFHNAFLRLGMRF